MSKTLYIVIPVYGQLAYTKKVLASIEKHVVTAYDKVVTIVVDNASLDDTLRWLTVEWSGINVKDVVQVEEVEGSNLIRSRMDYDHPDNKYIIANSKNLGYGSAINRALHFVKWRCKDADVLVMNNDMELLPQCIDKLKEATDTFTEKKVGIVGGKLLFPDGTIQHGGAFLGAFGWGCHKFGGISDNQIFLPQKIEEQEYVTGALMLITNTCLKVVGEFDEQFFMFFEEVDYCYRARDFGFKTIYTPYARAVHYEGRS